MKSRWLEHVIYLRRRRHAVKNQVRRGLAYIKGRYGKPQAAAMHERYGWYDKGGWLPPGKAIARNDTGRPERVKPLTGLDSWWATWLLLMTMVLSGAVIGAGICWLATQP